jgi:hypothetical protein
MDISEPFRYLLNAIQKGEDTDLYLNEFIRSSPTHQEINHLISITIENDTLNVLHQLHHMITDEIRQNMNIFIFKSIHHSSIKCYEFILQYIELSKEELIYCMNILYYEYLEWNTPIEFIKLFYQYYPSLISKTSTIFIKYISIYSHSAHFNKKQYALLKYTHSIYEPILYNICEHPYAILYFIRQYNIDALRYTLDRYSISYERLKSKLRKYSYIISNDHIEEWFPTIKPTIVPIFTYLIVKYNMLPDDIKNDTFQCLAEMYQTKYTKQMMSLITDL